MTKSDKYWMLIIASLLAIIATGSLIIWTGYGKSQPIEITIPPAPETQGNIYVGGAVNNPGFYPLKSGDSLEDIVRAAGGASAGADPGQFKLFISPKGEEPPQKVDLNLAEAWLLQALPGIGETRAQAIIEYRAQNGRFNNIAELVKVEGIGAATYENIEHLITVSD